MATHGSTYGSTNLFFEAILREKFISYGSSGSSGSKK
jgi:hypothetical protein